MSETKKTFKSLNLIFIAFLSMQIFLGLILYFLRDMKIIDKVLLQFEFLPIIILVINTALILFAKYVFTARNKIDKKLSIEDKIEKYKSYSLIIIAVIDFNNVINILIYSFTGVPIYLLVAVLILILFIVYRPSEIKFADSSLSKTERSQFLKEHQL